MLSIQIKEDYTKFSLKLDYQYKKISYFTKSYNERLDKMSANNKVISKVEIVKITWSKN